MCFVCVCGDHNLFCNIIERMELLDLLAKHEIRTMIYLDDGICARGTREEAMANRLFMVDTLQKSGQLG